jgi:alginate O-acetyltransferase complex protein AlgI
VIFLSYWFVFFALSFFPIYYLARDSRLRLGVLAGVIPIVVLAVLTYACAVSRRPPLCELATVACVASLVFYKYILFAATSIAAGWPAAGDLISTTAESVLPAAPPLAISIFVFEFVHYLYDVRRGSPPIRNPLKFGLFAIFWPSLVSGPIKRYQQFLPSLMAGVASVRATDSVAGLTRIAGGVVKKIAADNLTSWIEYQSARFGDLTIAERWLFLACLALRIYLDFSGYSDIAIGLLG